MTEANEVIDDALAWRENVQERLTSPPMPIHENALNSALADALSEHDLHATPGQTHANTGADRCDVQVRRKHGDRYFTAVECKIGQGPTQQHEAVRDAQRWWKQTDCWNALAVCYPEELSEESADTPRRQIMATEDLLMVRVGQGGELGRWRKGRLSELAMLADDIGANETYAVTQILQQAILLASQRIDSATGRDLARTLALPWAPRTRGGIDPRPARIACLIIANMALLQNRMRSQGRNPRCRRAGMRRLKEFPRKHLHRVRKHLRSRRCGAAQGVQYGARSDHRRRNRSLPVAWRTHGL